MVARPATPWATESDEPTVDFGVRIVKISPLFYNNVWCTDSSRCPLRRRHTVLLMTNRDSHFDEY